MVVKTDVVIHVAGTGEEAWQLARASDSITQMRESVLDVQACIGDATMSGDAINYDELSHRLYIVEMYARRAATAAVEVHRQRLFKRMGPVPLLLVGAKVEAEANC